MSAWCDEMERLGKGIGNANRFRVLQTLMKGEHTVGEIARAVRLAQPAVSQHLQVLKVSQLVSDERRGQEVYYSINVAYMANILKKLVTGVEKCPQEKKGSSKG